MTIDPEQAGAAVVAADDAFRADHTVVFGTESNLRRLLFEARARRFKDWDRKGPCLYRGCGKPSIRRSHTVQRARVLERIAEQGHVLTPTIDADGQMSMGRVGIGLASTFPGFCEAHELLFADFETLGVISEPRHLALQMFRTICREIAHRRFGITKGEAALEDYRQARLDHFAAAIRQVDAETKVHSLSVEGDAIETHIVDVLDRQRTILAELEGEIYVETSDFLDDGQAEPACIGFILPGDPPAHRPLELPVAVSGVVFVDYEADGVTHHIPCVVGVVPQEGGSFLYIGTTRQHEPFLEHWQGRLDNLLGMLNLVEGWMVHGADHWFITPSVWNALPSARRAAILDGLASTDGAPGLTPSPSIFDDLRRLALAAMLPQLGTVPPESRAPTEAMLAAEQAKLS